MTDRRLLAANDRVAAAYLKGKVAARAYSEGQVKSVLMPVLDLCRMPNGPRERQVLMGQQVTEYESHQGNSFVQSHKDGFVGYLPSDYLGPAVKPTHEVCVRATHIYEDADLKSPNVSALSFGACLRVSDEQGRFSKTTFGWVPSGHLRAVEDVEDDAVAVAERFLGTPYLWGGNSFMGIDCSGLMQAALLATGVPCPGDSDQQEAALGMALSEKEPLRRGDLIFWKGHVAMGVDDQKIIHANAHHMAVSYENVQDAIQRIAVTDGPVTSRRRIR